MISFAVTLKSYKEEMTERPQEYEICWNSGNMGYFQEAGAGGVLEKDLFLKILKNLQERIFVGVSFLTPLQTSGL